MRSTPFVFVALVLASCDTSDAGPCWGRVQARFDVRGVGGLPQFITCIGDVCHGMPLPYGGCELTHPETLPFPFELCAWPTAPGTDSLAVTLVAGPPATTIVDGETWRIGVLSEGWARSATASLPATFTSIETLTGAACLAGSFDFGLLEVRPSPGAEATTGHDADGG